MSGSAHQTCSVTTRPQILHFSALRLRIAKAHQIARARNVEEVILFCGDRVIAVRKAVA